MKVDASVGPRWYLLSVEDGSPIVDRVQKRLVGSWILWFVVDITVLNWGYESISKLGFYGYCYKLVNITPISLWFMTLITIVNRGL